MTLLIGGPEKQSPAAARSKRGRKIFGEHEERFSVPDAQTFAGGQRERGKQTQVVGYPGVGQTFLIDTRPFSQHLR